MVPAVSNAAESTHNQLKSKHHGVSVNKVWITHILSTGSHSPDQIYKRWLTTDLAETGGECLPPDVTCMTGGKVEVPGTLTLQLQSVLNVGSSFYSQLKKLTGKAVPEPTQNTQYNEPPPSRMLFLTLTDGTNIVNGMEYRPCSQLSVNLLPGTKILVSNVTARIGVLLLQPGNFRVLGGCVERLRLLYTQERVLKSALEGEEEGEEEEEDEDDVVIVNSEPANPPVPSTNTSNRNQTNISTANSNQQNRNVNSSHSNQQSNRGSVAHTTHNPYTTTSNPVNRIPANSSSLPAQKIHPAPPRSQPTQTRSGRATSSRHEPTGTQTYSSSSIQRGSKRFKTDPCSSTELGDSNNDFDDDDFEEFFEPEFDLNIKESQTNSYTPEISPDVPVKNLTTSLSFPVKITATISSLVSKLLPVPEWTAQALLTDRSGTKEMRLSEKLLSKMIGYTSQEFKQLKPVSSTNQGIKAFLRKGLETCQEDLAYKTGRFTVQLNTLNKNLSPFEVVGFEKINEMSEVELKEFVKAKVQ